MIPKIIHYCWFGGAPLPEFAQKCIASWKKNCPDYRIKEWNESNFDVSFCDFAKEAYESKKWAFLSDCARLYIIYHEGGIYLDTDVELIRPLDEFLDNKAFLGEETTGAVATGIGFGAEAKNPIIGELIQEYFGRHFKLQDGMLDMEPCPKKNTEPLLKYGYQYSGKDIWRIPDVTVYPPEYFCPLNYETQKLKITRNTVSIHHFVATWHTPLEKVIIKIERCDFRKHPIEYRFRRCVSFPLRVVNKIQKLGLLNTIKFVIRKVKG